MIKNSNDRRCGFRVKMCGPSSPHVKPTGDFGNAIAARRISNCFPLRVFAKNSWPCNFGQTQSPQEPATHTINYIKTPVRHPEVRALNGGRGVDHVIEVGGPDSFLQSLQAIRIGGQINMVGYIGSKEGAINPLEILYRRATVRGIPVGSRKSFEAMNRAIERTPCAPSSTRFFPGPTPSPQSATCRKESISEKSSQSSEDVRAAIRPSAIANARLRGSKLHHRQCRAAIRPIWIA